MLLACAVAASSGPLAGQQVIELTGDDRILGAEFEELYRVGSLHGGDWDTCMCTRFSIPVAASTG